SRPATARSSARCVSESRRSRRAPAGGRGTVTRPRMGPGGGRRPQGRGPPRVDELDGAVVTELEPLGEGADRGRDAGRHATDGEQQLVLPGLEPDRAGSLLAEAKEPSQLVAERRQRAVVRMGEPHASNYIV